MISIEMSDQTKSLMTMIQLTVVVLLLRGHSIAYYTYENDHLSQTFILHVNLVTVEVH